LVHLAALNRHQFVFQEKNFVTEGFDSSINSCTPEIFSATPSKKIAQALIRGQEPRLLLALEEDRIWEVLPKLLKILGLLENWYEIDIVVFTEQKGLLFEDGRKLTEKFVSLGNPTHIQRTDRSVCSTAAQKEWFAWVFSFKKTFLTSRKQPKTKEIKMMERGAGTETLYLPEPNLPDDIFVFQAHVSWVDDLKTHLQSFMDENDKDIHVVPGSDPKVTKYVSVSLSNDSALDTMHQFGGHPRFAVMPPTWLEGTAVDSKTDIFEVFINKNQRAETAPFMFGHLLNVFFEDGEVFSKGAVAIQAVSYNKCRLGLTKEGVQTLYSSISDLNTHGFLFKEEFTGTFLNQEEVERQTRTQSLLDQWGSVETCFLLNVPFYWPPSEVNAALDALGLDADQCVATQVKFSVGDMRTFTYRVEAPSVREAVNKTLRTSSGSHTLVVISETEYKHRSAPRPSPAQSSTSAGARPPPYPPPVGPKSQINFNFKRKRGEGSRPSP